MPITLLRGITGASSRTSARASRLPVKTTGWWSGSPWISAIHSAPGSPCTMPKVGSSPRVYLAMRTISTLSPVRRPRLPASVPPGSLVTHGTSADTGPVAPPRGRAPRPGRRRHHCLSQPAAGRTHPPGRRLHVHLLHAEPGEAPPLAPRSGGVAGERRGARRMDVLPLCRWRRHP